MMKHSWKQDPKPGTLIYKTLARTKEMKSIVIVTGGIQPLTDVKAYQKTGIRVPLFVWKD